MSVQEALAPGTTVTYLEAIRQGLWRELESDPSVFLLGEDIAEFGGAFKVTAGMFDRFGAERVINTPIAESAILGVAIGAALYGLRPVAEMQFIDFLACGFNPLVNFAATQHYRAGTPVPMVVRGPCGGHVRGSAFHSQNPEGFYLRAPGLKIVAPATVADAYGLIRGAIRDPNPVLYLEHKYLYRRIKGELPGDEGVLPLGQARLARDGRHLTVLTWGAMVHTALEAAERLAQEDGAELAVVDLRTLKPLDEALILDTVRRTSRALVLSEEPLTGSAAGEVAALVAEKAFAWLDAPVARLCCLDTPVPFSPPLEDYYLPNVDKLCARVRELLSY
ncbi:MAG TPA: alpha-ketoacid dehydrogenase subunit beta [Thermoanaerobaculia bacterium]|nr:alpha-ketoacid dehydrogenase subunit beta [Thermoanaerobaculia bacterium]